MLVRVLGPFEVEGDDGPVALAGAAQRAVLALLALRAGRPVGVAELIDALWPEDPPPSARNSLQSHVARLRARLGVPGIISLEPAGYRLNVPRSSVDALLLEDLLREQAPPAEAVSLWRGPPLPEFPAEPFRSAAARLVTLHRTALLRHAGSLPPADAAAELHAAFDVDPCWEEGTVALSGALAAAGARGDALEVLRRHADAVVDRLGLDPSDQIRQAQLNLLRGTSPRPEPARPVSVPGQLASAQTQPASVPGQPTSAPAQRSSTPAQPGSVLDQSAPVPGQPAFTPGQPAPVSGQPALTPGQPASAPAQPASAPAQPASASAQPASAPAQPASASAQPASAPAQRSSTPARPSSVSGQSGSMPGQSGSVPGQSAFVAGQPASAMVPLAAGPGQRSSGPGGVSAGPGRPGSVAGQDVSVPRQRGSELGRPGGAGVAEGVAFAGEGGVGDHRISPAGALWPGVGAQVAGESGDFSGRVQNGGLSGAVGRVPLRFSSFLGREGEQQQLAAWLAEPGLVSVVGPGGVGKTRLVAETVRAVPRVAWVDAADVREADFLAAVAVGVGARVAPHEAPVAAIAAAAERYPVVVLDNCEHVLGTAAELAESLRGVRVVVTSQESLRVDGERVLQLGPLAPEAARRLFCERARVMPAPVVGEIVERLDLLPLAIELAATQAAALGVTELHARLDDRLDLLSRGRRGGDPRHRTLRAVVEWSFGLLDPASARLLRRLAVFAGGFSVAAAEAVAADEQLPRARIAALLAGLVDRSLVARHGPGRFRLLETVRAYATEQADRSGAVGAGWRGEAERADPAGAVGAERADPAGAVGAGRGELAGPRETGWRGDVGAGRDGAAGSVWQGGSGRRAKRRARYAGGLAGGGGQQAPAAEAGRGGWRGAAGGRHAMQDSGDRAATEARHAAAMVAAAEELDLRMRGPEQAAAVREIDALLPDLRLAYARGSAEMRVRLAAAMYRYGYRCQHYEVLAWGRAAVDGPAHPDALAAAATHAWGRGELDEARKLAGRAEPPGAPAHEVLGDVALILCDAEAAIAHYQAMEGEPVTRVSGLVGEALVRAWSGQVSEAVELAGAAMEIADATGNPSARAEARYGLGEALGDTDPQRALELLDEAAALAGSVDDRLFQAAAGTAAVAVRSRHGDPGPALAEFREVLRLWRRAGNDTLHAAALRNLMVLLVRVGADETAMLIDAALPPAEVYPAEAARLDRARAAAAERLGETRVVVLQRRGALLDAAQVADEAVRAIDAALDRGRG